MHIVYKFAFISLLILHICHGFQTICTSNERASLIQFSKATITKSNTYQYLIQHHPSPLKSSSTQNGTILEGNFSSIVLKNNKNQRFHFHSSEIIFRYPAQHKVADLPTEIAQLQIVYQPIDNSKYKRLVLCVNLILSEFVPEEEMSIKDLVQNPEQPFSLNKLVSFIPQLSTIVYRGSASQDPTKQSELWLVRKQLKLINFEQLQLVKRYSFRIEEGIRRGALYEIDGLQL